MSDVSIVEPEAASGPLKADAMPAPLKADATPAPLKADGEAPLVEQELLVEDVSIDGMCGVY